MAHLPFAASAPVSVAKVGLKARNASGLAAFYREALELQPISETGGTIVLGAGGRPLLEIEQFAKAKPDDPREAGLFHTAFLLPQRADLARWMRHAIDSKLAITGASDHLVSEAIYLDDPEGNGIEIYVDRPASAWPMEGDRVKMATLPLDGKGLLSELDGKDVVWKSIPDDSIIGHVHLRVGDASEAERWWHDAMRFDTMARYGSQAVFLATGGYHHHVGANTWRSAGAGQRSDDRTGLSFVEFTTRLGPIQTTADPWGTEVRVVAGS